MKTVFYVYDANWAMWQERARGILRAAKRLRWSASPELLLSAREAADAFEFAQPAGCIVESGLRGLVAAECRRRGIPMVVFEERADDACSSVVQDADAPAREAFRTLSRLKLRNLACAEMPGSYAWSRRRAEVFSAAAAEQGVSVPVFAAGRRERASHSVLVSSLAAWLRALPKPCGVFAVNDHTGYLVLSACAEARLRVPRDVAVIGVDNNELICENAPVTLTSIDCDLAGSGETALEILAERIRDPSVRPRTVTFSNVRTVFRKSPTVVRGNDARVPDALEFVRLNCRGGITCEDVARRLGCSRRNADLVFMRALGKTVRDVIDEARLETAKELLSEPGCRVAQVAEESGFANDATFRRLFRRAFGTNPKAFSAG